MSTVKLTAYYLKSLNYSAEKYLITCSSGVKYGREKKEVICNTYSNIRCIYTYILCMYVYIYECVHTRTHTYANVIQLSILYTWLWF